MGDGEGRGETYKATSEPMLMRERMMISTAVRRTAFLGTSRTGSTLAIQEAQGRPWSRANWDRSVRASEYQGVG